MDDNHFPIRWNGSDFSVSIGGYCSSYLSINRTLNYIVATFKYAIQLCEQRQINDTISKTSERWIARSD